MLAKLPPTLVAAMLQEEASEGANKGTFLNSVVLLVLMKFITFAYLLVTEVLKVLIFACSRGIRNSKNLFCQFPFYYENDRSLSMLL